MSLLKLWFRAARPWSYPASIIPVSLGTMLAASHGFFDLLLFLLTLAGGVLIHTATNLFNDYYDFLYGVDTPDSYSSGSVLVKGLMPPGRLLTGAVVTVLLVMPIGLYLIMARGPVLLILGILGILAGYFYTARPIAYKYRGIGVPAVFFLMGPLMVIGAYYVQAASYNAAVFLASLPVGAMVGAILYANEFRDIKHDRRYGIVNPSILLGRKKARFLYYLLVIGAYILIIIMVLGELLSGWALLTLLTLPAALKPMRVMEETAQGKESPQLPYIDVFTAQLHLQFGLLLICGVFLGFFINI
jgi:1,4-dihydroxy-2-naphthoate octaprenyltransferase